MRAYTRACLPCSVRVWRSPKANLGETGPRHPVSANKQEANKLGVCDVFRIVAPARSLRNPAYMIAQGMLESPDAGDAGMLGMRVKLGRVGGRGGGEVGGWAGGWAGGWVLSGRVVG